MQSERVWLSQIDFATDRQCNWGAKGSATNGPGEFA